jgi:hypothetical protein
MNKIFLEVLTVSIFADKYNEVTVANILPHLKALTLKINQ